MRHIHGGTSTVRCVPVRMANQMSKITGFFKKAFASKKSKAALIIIALLVVVCTVLACIKPSFAELESNLSQTMSEEIKKDETRSRKVVSITENNLLIVNMIRFQKNDGQPVTESYIGFAGKTIDATSGFAKTMANMINYTYRMLGIKENILHGAKLTIFLTTVAVAAGLFLSIFLALGKISKFKPTSKLCSAYIFFFRGTPLMIQLFVVYLAVPGIIDGFSWRMLFDTNDPEATFKGAFVAAFIAFSLNSAAYCAEIVRAAILSIDKGQHEAAKALGMNYSQTMSNIIIPQSIGRLIPPVANEFIMILKDASLVFVISLQDITTISKGISSDGDYTVFIPALLIYLVITAFFSYIFNLLEKKFSRYL